MARRIRHLSTVLAATLCASSVSAPARIVTVDLTGLVTLSEIREFPEVDTVTASFTYDTEAEGELWTNDSWGITTTTYSGITASFRNVSGTFSVSTANATITIRRVSPESWLYTPGNSLRVSVPIADIPNAPSRTEASFIGFFSFFDSTRAALADGRLPSSLDLNRFQSTRFLFAWNRFPGDEAPYEYGGRFLSTPETRPPHLTIRHVAETGTVEIQYFTRFGFRYQLEFSDNSEEWHNFGESVTNSGGPLVHTASTLESRARIFRVRVFEDQGP